MADSFSEDALIEQPAIALVGKLGRETADHFDGTLVVVKFRRTRESPSGKASAFQADMRGFESHLPLWFSDQ